jgi:hypothetical protein
MPKRNEIVVALRGISDAIEDGKHEVLFVENECPFVDRACEAIEHGGRLDATSLASLIHYLGDMLEE